ncbi:hypothetical protein ACRE1U_07195 [Helicobacter himalayensis]|uniref:hypothetical protein n=1 Tax=Helicobacter himalayensis TaxID=1591088 RepID=UPI003D700697
MELINFSHNDLERKKQLCAQSLEAGKYGACVELCVEILSQYPEDTQSWNLAGLVMLQLKDFGRAQEYFEQGLNLARTRLQDSQKQMQNLSTQELNNNNELLQEFQLAWGLCEALWLNLAESFRRNNAPLESVKILHLALEEMPLLRENATLHFNLAKSYIDASMPVESVSHYTTALRLSPNDLGVMFNLANAQVRLEHFSEAIELYEEAYKRGFAKAGLNLASIYTKFGYFSQALEIFEKMQPHFNNDADFFFNYANVLGYTNADFARVKQYFERAIELDSQRVEFFINYAHFLLKNHHFSEGFALYEMRKKFENMLPLSLPNLWNLGKEDRQSFENKVVCVHYEQGFGDCIMFARFLKVLQAYAKEIIFLVQEPLKRLFADIFSTQDLSAQDSCNMLERVNLAPIKVCTSFIESESIFERIDVSISLLSLPLALGIKTQRQISANANYLAYQTMLRRALARGSDEEIYGRKPDVLKIGVCCESNSGFSEVKLKNIEPKALFATLRMCFGNKKKVALFSLSKVSVEKEVCEEFVLTDCCEQMGDFLDTRQILERMDLVISIDTALAHLSASMGKNTLVLLHKRYDWRYENGVNTSWYENLLGFTQSEMGKWDDVLIHLSSYLAGVYGEYV